MSKCDSNSSILRLRALREQLCGKEQEWKSAFEVRDEVVQKLVDIHTYSGSDDAEIKVIHEKLSCILEYLQITPDEDTE